MLWQQKTLVLQWPGVFSEFRCRCGLFKCCFFGDGKHIYSDNSLPIWLFLKRVHDREMTKPKQIIFCREHQFYIGREYFQRYHMLRPLDLRRMEARNRCPKSRNEQHKRIRILGGNLCRPEQLSSEMFMIKKNMRFSQVRNGIVIKNRKNKQE